MARKSSTPNNSAPTQKPKKSAASPRQKAAGKQAQVQEQPELPLRRPLIDDRSRRNIWGIVLVLVAVILILIVAIPSKAVITSALSTGLRTGLGIGAYLLPLFLLVIGGCFIARFENERIPMRVAIGLGMIYVALLILFALFTPLSAGDVNTPSTMFDTSVLQARGGLIGGSIAFAGLATLGLPISVVIAIGIIAVGLVIIGFSVRKLISRINEARRERYAAEEEEFGVLEADPYDANPYMETLPRNNRQAAADAQRAPRTRARTQNGSMDDLAKRDAQEGAGHKAAAASAGATQQLTRKLGAKKPVDEAANTVRLDEKPVSKDANGKAVKLATPKPQEGFELPDMSVLHVSKEVKRSKNEKTELAETAAHLQETLEDFGIMATVVDWVPGPTVTLFEIDLPSGVRVSKITSLNDDIALALAAPGVRIFAPVPGTHYVGIEVPNVNRENVLLGDVLKGVTGGPLQMAIGKDVEGKPVVCDLAKMPHLLIGGTTGSGKSVGINAMIMSMLMRATPAEVRFIMIDPKRVEFTPYNGIPHLYVPVVTEPKEAASALSWGVAEMERRLKVFSKVGCRNIGQYNAKIQAKEIDDEEAIELPYIVIIIDELADLMMNVGKEVEFSISRIAQLARAAGIHLIVATQRPSANVVTGLIKANITNRMSFNVASGLDSRVILDVSGAESLIGNGDLLLSKPEYAKPRRIQGCFVTEDEINEVVEKLKEQGTPEYHDEILKTNLITLGASDPAGGDGSCTDDDPLIWEAADIVVSSGLGSTSNIQRKLKVGYSRAGRIMDMLEDKGIVGPPNGSKPREVLVDAMELETLKAFENNDA